MKNTLCLKFTYALKVLIATILGTITILLCLLLRPFFKIKFGRLYTSRIGHLCFNLDNYLYLKDPREIAIFSVDNHIANTYIYDLWRQKKYIFFSNFAKIPLFLLDRLSLDLDLKVSFRRDMHPVFSCISAMPSNIPVDVLRGEEFDRIRLAEKINKNYICFHNRDSAYLEQYGGDGNNHDFRDFEFEDYRLSIEKVIDQGFTAVRLGEKIKFDYVEKSCNFISMTENRRSAYLDVALIANSLFYVGGSTGFSNISRMLRKPSLLVNYIPFDLDELSSWAANSIIIPKKLYSIKKKRYLKFFEMASLPYDIHYKGNFFADLGIIVEDNSAEEIMLAVDEMIMVLRGDWIETPIQQKLQEEFWDSVKSNSNSSLLRNHLGIKISSRYLDKNRFLI